MRTFLALILTSVCALAQLGDPAFVSALTVPSSAAFTPTDIASLKVWLRADSLSGSDGDTVTTWDDSSTSNWDFTASGGTEPYLTNNVVGTTFESVHFQAANNDYMTAPAGALGLHRNSAGATVVMVLNRKTAATNRRLYWATTTSTSNPRLQIGADAATSSVYDIVGRQLDADANVTSDTRTFPSGWFILTTVMDWTNGAVYTWEGDTAAIADTSFTTAGSTSDTDSAQIRIGGTGAASRTMEVQVAEVLVFNAALGSTDRQNVIDYLQAKFGL